MIIGQPLKNAPGIIGLVRQEEADDYRDHEQVYAANKRQNYLVSLDFTSKEVYILFQPVRLLVDIVELCVDAHYLLVLPVQLLLLCIRQLLRLHQLLLNPLDSLLAPVLRLQAHVREVLQVGLLGIQFLEFDLVVVELGVDEVEYHFIGLARLLPSLPLLLLFLLLPSTCPARAIVFGIAGGVVTAEGGISVFFMSLLLS